MGAWLALTGDPLAALVTPAVRLALPFITSGITQGLSANRILGALTDAGIGIRRADGLKVISALKTPFGYPGWIPSVKAADYPGADLFRVAAYPTSKNYTYTYEITGVNASTGETEVQHVSIVSDTLLTNDAAEALAAELGMSGNSGNALEDVAATLESVKLSPDFRL